MVAPFKRVLINLRPMGGTMIRWEIQRLFTDPTPWTFTVQWSRSPTDENWNDLDPPFVDVLGIAVDTEARLWSVGLDLYYRVQLETILGAYYSDAVQATAPLPRQDWLVARDIIRQERLMLEKFTGTRGLLFKRRIFGEPCPGRPNPEYPSQRIPSVDPDTGDPVDSECPLCFGTGLLCGYYPPIDMFCDISQKARERKVDGARGTIDDIRIVGRTTAEVGCEKNDIWIATESDERFVIHTVTHLSELRGVPLVQSIELRRVPARSVLYALPHTGSPCDVGVAGGYGEAY